MRRLRDGAPIVVALIAGAALGLGFARAGLSIVAAVIFAGACLAAYHVLMAYETPRRVRMAARGRLDPDAGPPPGAQPADTDLPERWLSAVNAGDWETAKGLLAPGLELHVPETARIYTRSRYLHGLRALDYAFPDGRTVVDDIVTDPRAANTIFVRMSFEGRPRRGRLLRFTHWERWTLDPGWRTIRVIEDVGVLAYDETA